MIFLFSSTFTFSQEVELKGPRISFDFILYDYGTIEQGGETRVDYTFTNTGDELLIISRVKVPCGCMVANWDKEPVAPGETGVISVKYDSKRLGPINKANYVYSNAVNEEVTIIRVKGRVVPKLED